MNESFERNISKRFHLKIDLGWNHNTDNQIINTITA